MDICEHLGPGKLMAAGWLTGCNKGCFCLKCRLTVKGSDSNETEPHGVNGMSNKDDGVYPENAKCTACLEEDHIEMKCPVWIKPSGKTVKRLEEIETSERVVTHKFEIYTPRTSRKNSPGVHSNRPPLSGVHIRKSDDESVGAGSAAGSQAGVSDYSSVQSHKRPNVGDYQSSSYSSRRSSRVRGNHADPEREDSYLRTQTANTWKEEKLELTKKLEEHELENIRLKRQKEKHEEISGQKNEKIKCLSKQESRDKEVEKEIREHLKNRNKVLK